MASKTKSIKIERNKIGRFNFASDQYTKTDLSECQLMTLLGAVFGATITNTSVHPNSSGRIDVTKFYAE